MSNGTNFSKFDPGRGQADKNYDDIHKYAGTEIHPKILELILNLQNNVLEHSNQICIATLMALKEFLSDYRVESGPVEASPATSKLMAALGASTA